VRAALYACTTAADLGQTVLDEKLPELRRYASMQDWEVVGEFTDAVARGTGVRPGYSRLCEAIAAGRVDVVVANAVHELFWDVTRMAQLLRPWTDAGVRLVCVRNSFDATTPAGWVRLLDVAALLHEWRTGRMRDRQRIGILRAELRAAGDPIAGRPRVLVNPLEIAAGYHRGLSQRAILQRVRRAGGRLSKGKLCEVLAELRETGQLDEERRQKALAERGGLARGGRRPAPGREPTDQEIIDGHDSGVSFRKLAAQLRALGASCSLWTLTKRLAALRAEGRLDVERRTEAMAARSATKNARRAEAA